MVNTFLETPLMALSYKTRYLLSTMLNAEKCVLANSGLQRDWRGLADACSIQMGQIYSNIDHVGLLLEIIQKDNKDFTVNDFIKALEQIERFDVIDDCEPMFVQDCKQYLDRVEKATKPKPVKSNESTQDNKIITYDDQIRKHLGHDEKHYDAFILYADEDAEFARELMNCLETDYKLQICDKERDLVSGITFEHNAILTLISERCTKLITIFSPAFFQSEVNKFFLDFGTAQGINVGTGMIIPLVYKPCPLPHHVMFYTKVYYQNVDRETFYTRLVRSIKPSAVNFSEKKIREALKNPQDLETEKKLMKGTNDERMQSGATKKPVQSSLETNKTKVNLKPPVQFIKYIMHITKNLNQLKSEKSIKPWNMGAWKKKVEQETNEDVKLPSLDDLDSLNNVELNENKKSQSRVQSPNQSEQEGKQNQNGLNNGKHETNDNLEILCENKPSVSPNRINGSKKNEAGAIPKKTPTSSEKKNTPASSEKKNTPTSSEKKKTPSSLEKKKSSISPKDLTLLFSKKFGSWKKRKETKRISVEDMEFPSLEGLDSLNDLESSKNTQSQAEQEQSEQLQLEEQNVEIRENEQEDEHISAGAIKKSTPSLEQQIPESPEEIVEPASPESNEASTSQKKVKKQKKTKRDSSPFNLEEKSKGKIVQRYLRRVMQKDKSSE